MPAFVGNIPRTGNGVPLFFWQRAPIAETPVRMTSIGCDAAGKVPAQYAR